MRKGTKRLLRTGILAGCAYAGWRWWRAQVPAAKDGITWESAPFPFPPVPRPSTTRPSETRPSETQASETQASAPQTPKAPATKPRKAPAVAKAARIEPSIEPGADGSCPATHPVKAKLASGIYHVPGGGNYERTKPDRCYVDPAAAEADGLRAAKR